jgi:hypothetical protein
MRCSPGYETTRSHASHNHLPGARHQEAGYANEALVDLTSDVGHCFRFAIDHLDRRFDHRLGWKGIHE